MRIAYDRSGTGPAIMLVHGGGGMGQDMLALVDACGVEHFTMWGMSFWGKIGRYLAVHSERVDKIILMRTPLDMGVSGQRRQEAIEFDTHWSPIVQAQNSGILDLGSLSQDDQAVLGRLNVPVVLAWVKTMLDWPAIEPADLRRPALWLIGSEDQHAMASHMEYEESLKVSRVQV